MVHLQDAVLSQRDAAALKVGLEEAYRAGRQHEREEWNPMVGRVLQVTQGWAVCEDPQLRAAAETIHAALAGTE